MGRVNTISINLIPKQGQCTWQKHCKNIDKANRPFSKVIDKKTNKIDMKISIILYLSVHTYHERSLSELSQSLRLDQQKPHVVVSIAPLFFLQLPYKEYHVHCRRT